MFFYFSQGLLLGGSAAAQPGPFQAYLLSQTMQHGWQRTLWAAFAPLISDGPIILLVLFFLTRLPASFLIGLQLVGGFFLLFLAYRAFASGQKAGPMPIVTIEEPKRLNILEATMMNALSPGPYIFWATVAGPILLTAWEQSVPWGVSFLAGFYGTLIGGFAAFITLFAVARRFDPRINRLLSWASGVGLLGFGLYQLSRGVTAVIGG